MQVPSTRGGLRDYYVREFNKHGRQDCATLATWMLILIEAFGEN